MDITIAETKILFVLCYYVVFGVITLAYFGYTTADQEDFVNGIKSYFTCEASGQRPNSTPCDPDLYLQYNNPELGATTYLLMGLITTANFIFVINWKFTKDKMMSCFRTICCRKKFVPVDVMDPVLIIIAQLQKKEIINIL